MWFTLQVNQNITDQITLRLRAVRHFQFSLCSVSLFLLAFFSEVQHHYTWVFWAFSFLFRSTTTEGCELKRKQPHLSLINSAKLPSVRQAGRSYLPVRPIWSKSRAPDTILKPVSYGFDQRRRQPNCFWAPWDKSECHQSTNSAFPSHDVCAHTRAHTLSVLMTHTVRWDAQI